MTLVRGTSVFALASALAVAAVRHAPEVRAQAPGLAVPLAVQHGSSRAAGVNDVRVLEAVKRRDHRALTALVRAKADINATQPDIDVVNQSGQTPIHASISGGVQRTQDEIVEVIQFLADKGAKLDEVDAAGRTAMTIAD